MKHSELLKMVAEKFGIKSKVVDEIVEAYLIEAAQMARKDISDKREDMDDKSLITRSSSIVNKNVGSFWVKYEKGADGENSLGGIEKAFYLRLKVRFSKAFNQKAFPSDEKPA